MGIRMAQPQGLNPWARKHVTGKEILLYTEKGIRIYPDGKEEPFDRAITGSSISVEKYNSYIGMSDDDLYPALRYTFPDGSVVEEHIHFTVWSSGPMIFLALKQNEEWIKDSLWSVAEVNEIESGLVDEQFLAEAIHP